MLLISRRALAHGLCDVRLPVEPDASALRLIVSGKALLSRPGEMTFTFGIYLLYIYGRLLNELEVQKET